MVSRPPSDSRLAGFFLLSVTVVGWSLNWPAMKVLLREWPPLAACYLTWFAALRKLPPSTATMGTLAVPVLGVSAGALMLGDPFGLREVAALALTLGGVALRCAAPRRRWASSGGAREFREPIYA